MKTKQIETLAGTDEIVVIDTREHPGNRARVLRTGVPYWTAKDERSMRGVEVVPVLADDATGEWEPYGYVAERTEDDELVRVPKTVVIAPRQIVETLAEREARLAVEAEERAEREAKYAAARAVDAANRRPIIARLYERVGALVVELDSNVHDAEQLGAVETAIDEAVVEEIATNVYRVAALAPRSYGGPREVRMTLVTLGDDVIDLDAGRERGSLRPERSFGRFSAEEFVAVAALVDRIG